MSETVRVYLGPPMVVGYRLRYFVRTTDDPDPIYCGACAPRVEFPTLRTQLWAGELPEGACCDDCGLTLAELEPKRGWRELPVGLVMRTAHGEVGYLCRVEVDEGEPLAVLCGTDFGWDEEAQAPAVEHVAFLDCELMETVAG